MGWARFRPLVALDAASVSGARLARSLGGFRLESVARLDLPAGVLSPSPTEPNVVDAERVRATLSRLVDGLGGAREQATLVLPEGVARGLVFEAAPGIAPVEQARFKLAASLPYPAREALVEVRDLPGNRHLGVAIRRRVVEEYESLAQSVGLSVERVDLAAAAALEGLLRLRADAGPLVDVILGDAALSLVGHADGMLRVFRSRLRDGGPEEADRLLAEVLRTAALAGDGGAPRVRIVGPGATALARALSARGTRADPGWRADAPGLTLEAAEIPWLGLALA